MAVMTIKVLATCAVVGFVLANLVHTSIAQSTPPLNEAGFFYGKDVIKQATDMLVIKALERQESILRDYVAFKSISSLYDQYGNETIACAEWLAANMQNNLGMGNAKLYESGYRYPVVVGSTQGSNYMGYPTVVIYGHYDVQPIDPIDLWTFKPFDMEKTKLEGYGEVFTGRGVSDNKGGSFSAIAALAILNSVLDGGLKALPINILLVIEGEEEIGSPGYKDFLINNKQLFENAKIVISADGGQPHEDRGALELSLRGMTAMELSVKGANTDLHSGTFGGSFLNPIVALTRLISTFHDPVTNKIAVESFYDGVEDLSVDEKEELETTMGMDDNEMALKLGVGEMIGEDGYTTAERVTVRPTLELVGVYGGFREEGIKTVLPSEAHAKISIRTVKGQEPTKLFELVTKHVEKYAPTLAPGLAVKVTSISKGERAYTSNRDSIAFKIAGEVLDDIYGKEHTTSRAGGSIGAVSQMHEVLGLDTICFAFSASDDFVHAPNERMRTSRLSLGQRAYIRLILDLADAYNEGEPIPFTTTFAPKVDM